MPQGLRIINDDSELLIDSELVNPTFVQKLEFNTTPTFTEAGPSYAMAHAGYIRRDYETPVFSIASGGNYIVLWLLPDNGNNDVWYNFPTSVISITRALTCSVYANSEGAPITYALPTAYIFAVNAQAINAMASTGPALRMYNSAGLKTFDSNFVQLVPYSITDDFITIFGADIYTVNSYYLPAPTNPIYMLPKSAILLALDTGWNYTSHRVFEVCYRRRGSYIESKTMVISYLDAQPHIGTFSAIFFTGAVGNLSVISADADFYQASGATTGGGANPTYSLSSNYSTVNEGTIITVTLTTTLLTNGSSVPWTITGISAADLVSGGLTGNFVVQNNSASASFTIKNDTLTEGTETFLLTLTGLSTSVSVTINDTSITPGYSWATPGTVNEGSTGSLIFNYSGAPSKTITFSIVYGTNVSSADVTLYNTSHTTPASNSAGTVSVGYSVIADALTEGSENFVLRATVDGTNYDSASIWISDTSQTASYGISAVNAPWNENTTQSTTVTLTNVNGYTYFPTSDNANVTCQTNSFTVNSNSYTTTLYWNVGAVTADTTVNLYLRRSSSTGVIDASTSVTVRNILPSGTYLSQYCSGVNLYYRYADGTYGGYYDQLYESNSTTCGYVAPTYSLTASPTSVNEGDSFTITLTTNQSGSFGYTITGVSSADIGGTSLTGTLSNGGTRTITVTADSLTEGTEVFSVSLDNGQASTNVSIADTSKSAISINQNGSTSGTQNTSFSTYFTTTVNGSQYPAIWSYSGGIPPGTSFTQAGSTYSNFYQTYYLSGTPTASGTYSFTVYSTASSGDSTSRSFSLTISPPAYPAAGTTSGGQYCSGYTLYQNYHDGSGGTYPSVVEYNSASCGYSTPSYSLGNTWTSLGNNSSGSFYLQATGSFTNGSTVTVSKSGTGASRVTLSTTSITLSTGTTNYYVTVTAIPPTGTIAEQSVTISLSTGNSFTFTLPAYTVSAAAPTITSVAIDGGPVFYPGEEVFIIINFSGPITADTYVNIRLSAGTYGQLYTPGYLVAVGPPGGSYTYGNIGLQVGTTSGYYVSIPNPGNGTQNNCRIYAMTMTAPNNGSARQTPVMSSAFVLESNGGGQIEA